MPTHDDHLPDTLEQSIQLIEDEYLLTTVPWVLGFSGGKDSSALLRLVFAALARAPRHQTSVTIVYCDTGVEIPVVSGLVAQTLEGVAGDAHAAGLPISVKVAAPRLQDRYFVKVIGRGYPPPTNKFRWCTDRLRINPVQRVIKSLSDDGSVVLLGVRQGESAERDRTLSRFATDRPYYFRQEGGPSSHVFAPVLDFSTEDVWRTVVLMDEPKSLDGRKLWSLYSETTGEECPLVREPVGSPCAKGRFGCWTCTVVRKDEAVAGLIDAGYEYLRPLLEYRDWLQDMRHRAANRCSRRRNGTPGPGPLTLAARRLALQRLREAEHRSGLRLLHPGEADLIHQLWREDRSSSDYQAIEAPA